MERRSQLQKVAILLGDSLTSFVPCLIVKTGKLFISLRKKCVYIHIHFSEEQSSGRVCTPREAWGFNTWWKLGTQGSC